VTLVHDVADHDAVAGRVVELAAVTPPVDITLTTTACWGQASYGVYVEIDDPAGRLAALQRELADLESPAWARVRFRPHVTLVHGRTVAPDLAEPAWAALCGQRVDWRATLAWIDVIALDEPTGWTSVQHVPLLRR
jgi:2'-5' RNA ligase